MSAWYMSDIAKAEQINRCKKPGSIAGTVIRTNGRLTFEDDLRSGGLLSFISMSASVRT